MVTTHGLDETDARPSDRTPGRRARLRRETTEQIKRRAWELIARSGAGALSLREVARAMDMAPSALYRYFDSRDALLSALIVEGYDSLTEQLRACYDELHADPEISNLEVFLGVSHAHRRWALENPPRWQLLYATTLSDYEGDNETTRSGMAAIAVLMQVLADTLTAGEIDVAAIDATIDDDFRAALAGFGEKGTGFPAAALAAAMWYWTTLHGVITLEVNHHLPPSLCGNGALLDSTIRAMARVIMPASEHAA